MSRPSTPMVQSITISEYILHRLAEIGLKDIFGVPGDFNLTFLDYVEDDPRVHWIGTSNELNGAYAADGYARIHGAAAFVTTYGVGELSAINAIAGSFAEQVPIIHIVGAPSTAQQNSRLILHHTLGTPVFDVFLKAYSSCSAASVSIDAFTTGPHIDRAIETCLHRNLPIYILLPQDMVSRKISMEPLSRPLNTQLHINDQEETAKVLCEILQVLEEAERPVILADAGASRDNVLAEVDELCRTCKDWPVYVSSMGKGSVNEQLPNFAGTYVGGLSHPSVPEYMEKADCVLSIGRFTSDFNTGFFTSKFPIAKMIDLHATYTAVLQAIHPGVGMKHLLPALTDLIQTRVLPKKKYSLSIPPVLTFAPTKISPSTSPVRHSYFWPRLQEFILEGDIIVAEPGTAFFGALDMRLPTGACIIAQYLWCSIGFGTAACSGAAVAAERGSPASNGVAKTVRKRRVVGLLGDGSFQMTCQEISTMVREGVSATLFILNNKGYTIEKFIHGVKREYNQINSGWNYAQTLSYFGAPDAKARTFSVDTEGELDEILTKLNKDDSRGLRLIVVDMAAMDSPRMLRRLAELKGRVKDNGEIYDP